MKKIFIIVLLLFFIMALAIIFLFNKNRQAFLPAFSPDLLTAEQATDNFSNSNNMLNISSVFSDGGQIPDRYGCHGKDVNPPLKFSGVPEGARSLALVIDDPDAPLGDWVHWLVFNINPQTAEIGEGRVPAGAVLGLNDSGQTAYSGPCPPSGTHHYHFKLYALNTILNLTASARKADLLAAMDGHVLSQTELVGIYSQ